MALTYCPHPMLSAVDRQYIEVPVLPKETLFDYLRRIKIPIGVQPFVIGFNDRIVSLDESQALRPGKGDIITVRAALHNGGGGGSNPLVTILTIAVLVFAPYAAFALASSVAATAAGASAVFFTTQAAVTVGGMLLIQAIAKPPALDTGDPAIARQFTINGGSNSARPMQPMTLIIGKVKHFPDLGAKEYFSQVGEDSFLHQVFNFGLSDLVLTEMKIGDTLVSSFMDVDLEESGADGAIVNFPGNVDTLPGAAIVADATQTWIERTGSLNTTRLIVDIGGQLNAFAKDPPGQILDYGALLEIEYRVTGQTTWLPFFGTTNRATVSGGKKPIRFSFGADVASGQYDVRVRWFSDVAGNLNPSDSKNGAQANLNWLALRSVQSDTADYTGQKRVGLRIRASGQLSGTIARFNAIASGRVPVWNGSAWVTQESSNPAWWFRWFALGKVINGQLAFGVGLDITRIDDAALKAWGAWCDLKGLQCNFDWRRTSSRAELLEVIARCGRAVQTWQTGKLGVVYDQANQPVAQAFGMGNIVLNSFHVDYTTQRLADEVVGEFINPAIGWELDTVRAVVPGVTNPQRTATLRFIGITDKAQAGKEVLLQASRQVYHRKRITWESDFEGMVANRGDVVELSHDLTQWGESGRLVGGTTTVMTLDHDVYIDPVDTNYIGLREPDGTYLAHEIADPPTAGNYSSVILLTPLAVAPDNNKPVNYIWLFGPSATPGNRLKIVDVNVVSESRVRLTAIPEVSAYYASENGSITYVPPNPYGNRAPEVRNVQIIEELANVGGTTNLNITWDLVNADRTSVRIETDTGLLEFAGTSDQNRYSGVFEQGQVLTITLSPVTLVNIRDLQPIPYSASYTILGLAAIPSDVQNLTSTLEGFGARLSWDYVSDLDVSEYEIREGANWATSTFVARVQNNEYQLGLLADGPHTYLVKAVDIPGNLSALEASVTFTVNLPSQLVIANTFEGEAVVLTCTAPVTSFAIAEYEIRYGNDWASGTFVAVSRTTSFSIRVNFGGTRRFWVAAIDAAGNTGTAGSVDVVITPPAQPTVTQDVIDNNVLLRWSAASGSLTIATYEIRKGSTFATATVLQRVNGTFATFFENQSGTFTYWVAPVDSAGNFGVERSITAQVDEPPDFQLINDYFTDFLPGTKTNALVLANGDLMMPVNANDSYQAHFVNNGYNTPQDQINAGFLRFIQPSVNAASYEEIIDYGAVLTGSLVSLILNSLVITGNVTVTPTISYRKLATDAWTDNVGVWQIYATNFQFVKIRLDVSASGGDDLLQVLDLETKLNIKLKNDAGSGTANAADPTGTAVTFNKTFIDITSINLSPNSTAAVSAVYDFVDAPNPTGFSVYLYDQNGARVSGAFSWTAKGF